jgi:hypothetical protein
MASSASYNAFSPIDMGFIERLRKQQEPLFEWEPETTPPYYIKQKVNIPRPLTPNYGLPGKGTYKIVYTYPLGKPYVREHTLTEPEHLIFFPSSSTYPDKRERDRLQRQAYNNPSLTTLLEKIEDDYQTLYDIEEDNQKADRSKKDDEKDTPPFQSHGLLNRGSTNGAFYIGGHVLDDLILDGIAIYAHPDLRKKDEYYVIVDVGS